MRVCSDEPDIVTAARRTALGEAQNSEVEISSGCQAAGVPAVVDTRIGWQRFIQDIFDQMRLDALTSFAAPAVAAAEEAASEASEEEEMAVAEEAEAVE